MDQPDEAACRGLLAHSYHLLDAREHGPLAELFTEDGVWHRDGKPHRGRPAILASLQQRAETRRTLHVVTGATISLADTGRATGVAYLMVTIGFGNSGNVENWIVTDRYARAPDGWRIAERVQRPASL